MVDQDGWETVYTWRGDGQRSAIRVIEPDDLATMYHAAYLYDKAGRLEYVQEPLRGGTDPNICRFAYDDNGNREALTYYPTGNPVAVGYGYNADNLLTSYTTTGGPYHALTRTVDGLGRSVTLAETQTRQNGQSLALNWAYVYDLRSQIRSVAGTVDGVLWGGSYQYRKDGNIDRQTVQGTETIFGYSGDLLTQRGQQDLGWDGNGQLTSDEVRTIGWTWDGQLRSATNAGGGVVCRYDPDGNRIRKEVQATGQPTQARKFIVDAEGDVPVVLLEIDPAIEDPNLAIVKTFLYADTQLVAFHDGFYGDSLYFALSDQHGSVRQVMNDSGAVVNGYAYDPWGLPLSAPAFEAVTQPIRYAGYWWDSELARYYCWARYYDPLLERFLSRDPESGSFEEPMELHRYLYCLNDPINRLDPDGEFSFPEITVGAGINSAVMGLNAYGMYQNIRGYAKQFTAGVSMRNIALQAVTDAAYTMTAGAALGYLAKTAAPLVNKVAQKVINIAKMRRVRKMGRIGEKVAGITKNTERIDSITGSAAFRIPDEMTKTTLREVKNVKYLSFTSQIQDYLYHSLATDREFILVVRESTKFSKELQKCIDAGFITLEYLP